MNKNITDKLDIAGIVAREVENRINVYCTDKEQVETAKEIIADYPVRTTVIDYGNGVTKIEVKE